MYTTNPKTKRIEFRSPDPAANPYLAFAACLMAGLDGIKHKILPAEPVDKDIYELDGEEKARIKSVPGSLAESLDALEKDHAFLIEGEARERLDALDPVAHRVDVDAQVPRCRATDPSLRRKCFQRLEQWRVARLRVLQQRTEQLLHESPQRLGALHLEQQPESAKR